MWKKISRTEERGKKLPRKQNRNYKEQELQETIRKIQEEGN